MANAEQENGKMITETCSAICVRLRVTRRMSPWHEKQSRQAAEAEQSWRVGISFHSSLFFLKNFFSFSFDISTHSSAAPSRLLPGRISIDFRGKCGELRICWFQQWCVLASAETGCVYVCGGGVKLRRMNASEGEHGWRWWWLEGRKIQTLR